MCRFVLLSAVHIDPSCQTLRAVLLSSSTLCLAVSCAIHCAAYHRKLSRASLCAIHCGAYRRKLSDVLIHSSHSSLPRRKNCPMPRAALLTAFCIAGDSQTYRVTAPTAFLCRRKLPSASIRTACSSLCRRKLHPAAICTLRRSAYGGSCHPQHLAGWLSPCHHYMCSNYFSALIFSLRSCHMCP